MNNSSLGKIATIVTTGAVLLGAAVGFGSLKGEVKTNKREIVELKAKVDLLSTNAAASAAGAMLIGMLREMNAKLDALQAQMDRLEQNAH